MTNLSKKNNLIKSTVKSTRTLKTSKLQKIRTEESGDYLHTIESQQIEVEDKYRSILENIQDAYIRADKDGKIIMVSPSAVKLYGFSSLNEMIGLSALSLYKNQDDRVQLIRELEKNGKVDDFESEALRKDGKSFLVSLNSQYHYENGQIQGTEAFIRDITKRKKAEKQMQLLLENEQELTEELQASNEELLKVSEMLSTIYELNPDAIVLTTFSDSKIIDCNQEYLNQTGYTREEVIGHTSIELNIISSDERKDYINETRQNDAVSNYELKVRRKDGTFIDVLYSARIITIDKKQMVLNIGHDITQRKRNERQNQKLLENEQKLTAKLQKSNKELEVSEERFHDLADNIPNLAWMANADGWIFWYNKQWYDYTGTTPEEMEGWGWRKVHHPDYVESVIKEWSTKILEGKPYYNIFPLKGKNGKYRWFLTRVTPIKNEQGTVIRWFGTNTDITEQKRVEELKQKLLESEQRLTEELKTSNEELQATTEELNVSNEELQATGEELQVSNEELRHQTDYLVKLNQIVKESEEKFLKAFHSNPAPMTLSDSKGRWIDVNESYSILTGYRREELIGHTSIELNLINAHERNQYITESKAKNSIKNVEFEIKTKSGEKRFVISSSEVIRVNNEIRFITFMYDITDSKKAEFERKTSVDFLRLVNESRNNEDLIHSTVTFFKNQTGCEAVGIRLHEGKDYPYYETNGFPDEFIKLENHLCDYGKNGKPVCDGEGNPIIECMCGTVISGKTDPSQPFFTKYGSFWTNSTSNLLASTSEDDRQSRTRNRCNGMGYESVALIPLRSGVKNFGLIQLNDRRRNFFTKELILFWERLAGYFSIGLAKFKAEQEIIEHSRLTTSINGIFEKSLTSSTEAELINKYLKVSENLTGSEFGFFGEINEDGKLDDRALSPPAWDICKTPNAHELLKNMEIRGYWGRTIIEGKSQIVNNPDSDPDRRGLPEGHPPIHSFLGVPLKLDEKPMGMIALANKANGYTDKDVKNIETLSIVFVEVLMRRRTEKKMEENVKNLAISNKELEQFAYITSHDLREPLRMITSFLQLLQKRYSDKLDQDANEFIGYAVDGAKRLDTMTNDLLQYSKITSKKREITLVNFEKVLNEALLNLKVPIEETNAIITHDPLPVIKGDEELKVQLFQNLIANAIKYRGDKTPEIHISAIKDGDQYLFSVKDNGIGISQKHLERIFTIFQRLHTREEYEGTGIGLAIAQKIIHQQGGRIWAESEPGKGTTFFFTIINKTSEFIV